MLVVLGIWLFTAPSPQVQNDLQVGETGRFPDVQGNNLDNEVLSLPAGFSSPYNVVVLPYTEAQQNEVNTWLDFLKTLRAEYPVSVYEIPVMEQYSRAKQ